MNFEESIDEIIQQEQKEIKAYWIIASVALAISLILFIWNIVIGERKDLVANATNILTLAAGYVPVQQIIKRRKRIKYLDKIIRLGLSANTRNRQDFEDIVIGLLKEACTN